MTMNKFLITDKGLEKLQIELKNLKHHQRPSIIEAISVARDQGDLSENAEYHAAREKQSFIEARIADLEDKFSRAHVMDAKTLNFAIVHFGATVQLQDDDSGQQKIYTIVGEYEADIAKSLISITSPLGRALISKQVGDIIEVVTPKGLLGYQILKIEYNQIDI